MCTCTCTMCICMLFCLLTVVCRVSQAEYDKLVPAQKIRAALNEAERLSESLRERYSRPQGKRQKLDTEEPQGEEGVTDQQVPNDATDSNKPLSAEDLYKRSSVSNNNCNSTCSTCTCTLNSKSKVYIYIHACIIYTCTLI